MTTAYEKEIAKLMRRRTAACVRLLRARNIIRPHVMAISIERRVIVRRRVFYLPDGATPSLAARLVSLVLENFAPVALLACYAAAVDIEVQRDSDPEGGVALSSRAMIVNGALASGATGSLYVLLENGGATDESPVLVRDGDPGILRDIWPLRLRCERPSPN